ncbi:MAG: DNA mismatch repair protein MutS [Flavobacteriales bacterium]|nr:DNA mismatch repair protein MutS [Flavobacteriales bacterium]
MKQYNQIKAKYPDAVLLFRVGDFYETFGKDAIEASKILGIVLTKRSNGGSNEELAGFPHHSLNTYLPKLVRAGKRVAICEQLEDPKKTKKIVKRGVTELVTPGVSYNDQTYDAKNNNYLASIHFSKDQAGISFLDISTGEFYASEGSLEYIDKLVQSFQPSEIVYQKQYKETFEHLLKDQFYSYRMEDWAFTYDYAIDKLRAHFGINSLKGFGLEKQNLAITAAGAILHYLEETQHQKSKHIQNIQRIDSDDFLWMDRFTIRNLELFHSHNPDAITLIDILDQCKGVMGSRMLKRWLAFPLKEKTAIENRQEVVDYFLGDLEVKEQVCHSIQQIGDIERLASKISTARISPREIILLKNSLKQMSPIKTLAENSTSDALKKRASNIHSCEKLISEIEQKIVEDAPVMLGKGVVIQPGVHPELDEYRQIAENAQEHLNQICEREAERTQIAKLKIGYNNVFGYYLEVRNTHKAKVPEEWIRKQTLVSAERYITEELKELEAKILASQAKIEELEKQLFDQVLVFLSTYIDIIQRNALAIAEIDVLLCFADLASQNEYQKPKISEEYHIDIKEGRHPVIEKHLPLGETYISNSIFLDREEQQIIMITGPNMSGKSALLRQTALIVLMAQIGCFVPAESAEIGVVDKIFTRVGASDNISHGESTFMVEMNETASILNNLSDRSLVLLDEIGRGTSTYDGISIAWAIAEYLHKHSSKAKTLFATHYHELNEMSEQFARIKNYNVAVKEADQKIVFIRKLKPGGSEHSFGIHVAKMAGMPKSLIKRANTILAELESSRSKEANKSLLSNNQKMENGVQLSFFQLDDPSLMNIKEELENIDINSLTPIEALMKLNQIKKMIGMD